jgi:replication factor C subunit 1
LAVCITGIVPNLKGTQAETAAQRRGARTTKNVSSKTQLLVIGDNAGDTKIQRAEYFNTPIITSDEFLALI